jgi:alkyl hydroperoxide reductase subunit D
MNLQELREQIPDFARDIKLNLESILSPEGTPGLTPLQSESVALACAYAVRLPELASAIKADRNLAPEIDLAAKASASIMAMNNVYYRSMHLIEDEAVSKLPARLRMNVLGKPGIPKVDFELMSLAVSAISGCGMCLNAHLSEVRKHGISNEGIQSSIRIGAVVNATAAAFSIPKSA